MDTGLLVPVDLSDEIVEDFAHVGLRLGGRLEEGAVAELGGQLLALVGGDHPLVLQIALVADQHHGHRVHVLHTQDLLAQVRQVVESVVGRCWLDRSVVERRTAKERKRKGCGSVWISINIVEVLKNSLFCDLEIPSCEERKRKRKNEKRPKGDRK